MDNSDNGTGTLSMVVSVIDTLSISILYIMAKRSTFLSVFCGMLSRLLVYGFSTKKKLEKNTLIITCQGIVGVFLCGIAHNRSYM